MDENLINKAINFAISCDWQNAIKINLTILKYNKSDIDSLNRLAKAYFETGLVDKAKKTSKKVLKLDPSNKIAANASEKYKNCSDKNVSNKSIGNINASVFIEEIGKTKLINLINFGSIKTISSLSMGEEVNLCVHSHRVTINTFGGKYIGKIPDDISARLRILVKGGNIYKTFVKSANKSCIKILIKEISKSKNFDKTISFPDELSESVNEDFTDPNS